MHPGRRASGCVAAAAPSAVIEMLEVFETSSAESESTGAARGEDGALGFEGLDHGFDQHLGVRCVFEPRRGVDQAERPLARAGFDAPLLLEPGQRPLHRAAGAIELRLGNVDQYDLDARGGERLGDPAAHRAGAGNRRLS